MSANWLTERIGELLGRLGASAELRLDALARHYAVHSKGSYDRTVIVGVERNNHGHAVILRLRQLHDDLGPYASRRRKGDLIAASPGWTAVYS